MTSVLQWARSKRPLPVEWEIDPCDGGSFSWSGITLVVDLGNIDRILVDVENAETVRECPEAFIHQSEEPQDAANEPGGAQETISDQHHDAEAIKNTLVENHGTREQECAEQQTSKVEKCGFEDERDRGWTQCTWPDWGEPLPPEDEDDMNIDYVSDAENSEASKKVVSFSDVITTVDPTCIQEERGTDSFSYGGSSDEELEQGTEQVTCSGDGKSIHLSSSLVSSQEEEAACHLLELGNELNCRDLEVTDWEATEESGRRDGKFYDPRHDLERLSDLLEKLYALTPGLSIVSGSQGSVSSEKVGTWTIEVSEDSGRFRMKRIKREKDVSASHDFDDDNDVLERPASKRHYKSLRKL